MDVSEAQYVIEALRKGIPPDGYVRYFTVGRHDEINDLTARLHDQSPGAVLLKANYGAGKSHLLRLIREDALREGYAVSTVTLDSKSAVRFNRMDQIFGAVCRGLEVPGALPRDGAGIRPFFNRICRGIEKSKTDPNAIFWRKVTDYYEWTWSEALELRRCS